MSRTNGGGIRWTLTNVGLGAMALGAVLTAGTAPSAAAQVVQPPVAQVAAQGTTSLPVTPNGGEAQTVTPAQTEGPYFKPNSPERISLVDPAMAGTRLIITGRVLTTDSQPVAGALLDFWQADDAGSYDNRSYTLRGHQYTDANGQYTVETVVPGLYPGRTRHVHVKVQAPNGPVLTTQLYFPGEARNSSDGIFDSALLLPVQDGGGSSTATFDFVVKTA